LGKQLASQLLLQQQQEAEVELLTGDLELLHQDVEGYQSEGARLQGQLREAPVRVRVRVSLQGLASYYGRLRHPGLSGTLTLTLAP
jgi:hypothetical protein